MSNKFGIPKEVEKRLRRTFKLCAYCSRRMRAMRGVAGCPRGKATIEHLNRNGPFYWSDGLKEVDLVLCCAQCNASRGIRKLREWFKSPYCLRRGISAKTVASRIRQYLRTKSSKR